MDPSSLRQQAKDRQNRWLRERQAELDRQRVVAELQQQRGGPDPSAARSGGSFASPSGAPQHQQQPAAAYAAGGYGSPHGNSSSPAAAHRSSSGGPAAGHAPQQQQQQPAGSGWGGSYSSGSGPGPGGAGMGSQGARHGAVMLQGLAPEEVIDRLTERITDRLRSELKVELQKESDTIAAQHGAMDTFLAQELESQNTCPICYDVMMPPARAPILLFPCGHTFCHTCISSHIDKNKKTQCPLCRKKIESKAPNYSLQQLIQQFVAKKEAGGGAGGVRSSMAAGGGMGFGGAPSGRGGGGVPNGAGHDEMGDADRMRRQAERTAMRLSVLRNELADTLAEEAALGGRMAAAAAVAAHMEEEEQEVLRRLAAIQAELELVRGQLGGQQAKVADLAMQADGVRQRKELLQATLVPLEAEVEKLEVLMAGLSEQQGG